jgi:predicted transcriptional regulator
MTRRAIPKPTDAELAILRVLWSRGPSTVRAVTEALQDERGTGYTTALKLLQIMTEKGLVRREDSQRTHIYEAALPRQATERQLVHDLLDRAFGGSTFAVMQHLLDTADLDSHELQQIRQLISRKAKEQTS